MDEQTFQTPPNTNIQPPRPKSPLPWLGVLVLVLIAGLAGGYWFANRDTGVLVPPNTEDSPRYNQGEPSGEPPAEVANVTVPADWQTYHNEEYGFEVSYPNEFIVFDGFLGEEPIEASAASDHVGIARNSGLLRRGEAFQIGIQIVANKLDTPQAWLDANKENYSDVSEVESVKSTTFAGKETVEMRGGCNLGSVCQMYILRTSPDYLLVITINGDTEELNQILSTFRFIK